MTFYHSIIFISDKIAKMRRVLHIALLSMAAFCFASVNAQGRSQNPARIPMESIKTLYFKDGHKTLSRRGKPFPQLQCIGNSKHICDTYGPDIVLCKSQGDGAWKCEADLHHSVRFGNVDVSCEGWEGPHDEYVMRGSCMLKYTVLPNYPDRNHQSSSPSNSNKEGLVFLAIIAAIFLYFFWKGRQDNENRGNRGSGGTWRGGGGGGGGGGGYPPNDPPPPYRSLAKQEPGTSSTNQQSTTQTGWRPGFWTGMLGGVLANETARYMRGTNTTGDRFAYNQRRRTWLGGGADEYDPFDRFSGGMAGFGGGGGGNAFGPAGPSRSRSGDSETRTAYGYGGSSVR